MPVAMAGDSDATASTSPGRRALDLARRAYVVALAALLVWALARARTDLVVLVADARPALLGLALLLALGQLGVSAGFWTAVVRRVGGRVAWPAVLAAAAQSLPARYVPGSIWYPLGRAATLAAQGVSKRALGVAAGLEAVLGIVVTLGLGAFALLAAGVVPTDEPWQAALAALAVAALLAAASPPAVNLGLRLLARRRGGEPAPLTWRGWAVAVAWTGAFWLWSATTFSVYVAAFGIDLGGALRVAGAFLVAWGVGFVSLFAPQGLGVFEVTAATLLAGRPTAALAVLVGGYRALMALRDGIAFGAAMLLHRR